MLKLLLSILPAQYKAYVDIASRMFERLDTAEERNAAIQYFITATESDGYMSVGEGSRWLSMLGLLGKPKPKSKN
jgi:hypothetical protein|tara:strand:+ start:1049 stop:1273 length:225 start_codon:yes stop_codon:yes gene_type:complete